MVPVALLLTAVAVALPFGFGALPHGHDTACHFWNGLEYADSLRAGVVVAHLAPNFYAGYGGPNFKYYPPYAYLPVSLLFLAGVPYARAYAAAIALAFFVSGLGTYLLARLYLRRSPAVAAALAGMLAPYHLHDIYRRFAYPELWGFALAPLALWALTHAVRRPVGTWTVFAAALHAAVGLVHPLTGLLLVPTSAAYGLLVLRRAAAAGRLLLVGLMAAGLGAFYALPAILERDQIYMVRQFRSVAPYRRYALTFSQLLGLEYRSPWIQPLAGWPFLLAALAGGWTLLRRRHPARVCWWLGLGALVLTTPPGAAAARLLRPLTYLQFPWRFLLPASVFLAVAAGAWARGRRRFALLLLLLGGGVFLTLRDPGRWDVHPPVDAYPRGMRGSFWVGDWQAKYLPLWALEAPSKAWVWTPRPVWRAEGVRGVAVREEGPEALRLFLTGAGARWRVVLGKIYVPGWRSDPPCTVGRDPETGLLAVAGSGGREVRLRYVGTGLYRLGVRITWATLLLTAVLLCRGPRVLRLPG